MSTALLGQMPKKKSNPYIVDYDSQKENTDAGSQKLYSKVLEGI